MPYKGTLAAMPDLLTGKIHFMFSDATAALPQIKAGKVTALGTSGAKQTTLVPGVPPIANAVPGFDALAWQGVVAPAGTPREIVVRLNAELNKIIDSDEFRQQLTNFGMEPNAMTVDEFGDLIKADVARWADAVKKSGAKVETEPPLAIPLLPRSGQYPGRLPAEIPITGKPAMTPAIDVHTHCLTEAWFELLQQHGGPRYDGPGSIGRLARDSSGRRAFHDAGSGHVRLRCTDQGDECEWRRRERRVADLSELLLGRPGDQSQGGADHERRHGQARTAYPGRIEWFASLPWQYPDLAPSELDRACSRGAKGVMVLANIDGKPLTSTGICTDLEGHRRAQSAGSRAPYCTPRRTRYGHGALPVDRIDRLHL